MAIWGNWGRAFVAKARVGEGVLFRMRSGAVVETFSLLGGPSGTIESARARHSCTKVKLTIRKYGISS